jgi:hypothetical protein
MALKVEVSAACEIDLKQACQWYESQRAQLASQFLNDFAERPDFIAVNPHIGVEVYRHIRNGGSHPRQSSGTLRNRIIEQ